MKLRDLDMGIDNWILARHVQVGPKTRRVVTLSVHPIVEAYLDAVVAHGIRTENIAKISVRLTASSAMKSSSVKFACVLGVALPVCEFKFTEFMRSSRAHRREMILDALHRGVMDTAQRLGIDPEGFEKAREVVIRGGMIYEKTLGAPAWNRQRNRWATLRLAGDLDCGELDLLVGTRDDSKILTKRLKSYSFLQMFSVWEGWKIRWRTQSQISIWTSRGPGAPKMIIKNIDVSKIR